MTTTLFASQSASDGRVRGPFAAIATAMLRVPLILKITGANLMVLAVAMGTDAYFWDAATAIQIAFPLVLSFLVTSALVWLALRPIAQLESTADRVASGDFGARVPESRLADKDLMRLATTTNRLLDRLDADRARIHYLAGRSVRARDIERQAVARELRESFAQSVAAVALQLAATQRVNQDAEVEQQLGRARTLVSQLGEDMRGVAETLYPGTLGEFGLLNAIQALARRANRKSGVVTEVDGSGFRAAITAEAASALYRTADEALRNVAQHAGAKHARIVLRSSDDDVVLEIEDDGRGMDMRLRDPLQAGLGLFSAQAVLALAGGGLQISSAPSSGTRVVARVPTRAPR
jgi:two-component system sensor histidine kinase UhpB